MDNSKKQFYPVVPTKEDKLHPAYWNRFDVDSPDIPSSYDCGFDLDVFQCCARIGCRPIQIEAQEPEFMDDYPAGTYQDIKGYVYGMPCISTVDEESQEKGIVFCTDHMYGYEDIREAPKKNPSVDN
jgi:hypothetical protein